MTHVQTEVLPNPPLRGMIPEAHSLDGVSVKINGLSAYVSYISPGQVNALIPDSLANGKAQVTVWNGSQSVASGPVTVDAAAAGILSWPLYDTRWVMALFPDYVTFVSVPGISSSVPSRAAKAGDIITIYAVGLGPLTPAVPAGQIAAQPNNLAGNLQVLFNSTPATVLYAGSAPGTVGLYQINLIVPASANSSWGDLSLKLNGVWTAVATYRY